MKLERRLAARPGTAAGWALVLLVFAGCASTTTDPEQAARVEESLDDILSQPLDEAEYGKPRRCLSSLSYRDYQALGDRYLVFDGPGDRLWLNEMRGRCPGLDRSSTLAFRQHGISQMCKLDQFKIVDWFAWPRYQRWPWNWLEGIPCTLGEFRPVTAEQVEAIRATLR